MKSRHTPRKQAAATDWADINRRLEQTRMAIEELDEPGPERQQQILRERAAVLAKSADRVAAPEQPGQHLDVLEFMVAGERYAFETVHVDQVYPITPITPIPGVPDFVVGIIMAQGEVLSVIDLRLLLDLPISGLLDPVSIIALKSETMEFGILAEQIVGIESMPRDAIERNMPSLADKAGTYLQGVSANRTAVLDAARLLADPRLAIDAGRQ
ncbi:CheW protein [Paucimonas lemoignei]|uniref:CheW protein n=1 Tax=Paucimonas lemoignei TaxID=29443 RepID=A0A4R3HZW6_PAULE|nr:chemotaxis protein CheW [Paucimonas lemoignei]TCS38454.1 CheW protein [Paucimonas lemoignei]